MRCPRKSIRWKVLCRDPTIHGSLKGCLLYTSGISQYGQHGSLDNCREGFLQGLEQAGLVEGTDFEVDYQNANFDDNQATQIGQMFSAEDADLMVGIATNLSLIHIYRRPAGIP